MAPFFNAQETPAIPSKAEVIHGLIHRYVQQCLKVIHNDAWLRSTSTRGGSTSWRGFP